ncbi:MAG: hypothetical protein RH949_20000 [Coleofasciculus sp. A1-SPW-01]
MNEKPINTTVPLQDGDTIRIGLFSLLLYAKRPWN